MVGSSLMRRFAKDHIKPLTVDRASLDLRNSADVDQWMSIHRPEIIILCAAKVGGIGANSTYPADFLYDNLMIEANVIHAAHKYDVEKLLLLGSSCIYPKLAEQPIKEDALLSGYLEPTNEAYAIAKIAGIKMCQMYRRQYGCNFISAMPCNLYGIGDTYDPENSHVIPAMIMKFEDAKRQGKSHIEFWGTGTPLREFLNVDDLTEGLICILEHYNEEMPINVGSGQEINMSDLAHMMADISGFKGEITFNSKKPDGTPRKVLNNCKVNNLGWFPKIELKEGLEVAYKDYLTRI